MTAAVDVQSAAPILPKSVPFHARFHIGRIRPPAAAQSPRIMKPANGMSDPRDTVPNHEQQSATTIARPADARAQLASFRVVRQCFDASPDRHGIRLIEFSVLSDHLHLLVEADTSVSLARGVQGLASSVSRALYYGERGVDPFSSESPSARSLLGSATSWLLRFGWRKARSFNESTGR